MVADKLASETERNRLLRRVDWRFLLPDTRPQKVICLGGGLLAAATHAAFPSVGKVGKPDSADCDLVVSQNPDTNSLQVALSALRPGGAFYSEWHSPLAGGEQGIGHRLQAAGFEDIACYWALPSPDRAAAAFWLPLMSPKALRYFQSSRSMTGPLWQRVAYEVRWFLWRAALRAHLMVPICAIARKPGTATSREQPTTLDTIRAGWQSWGLGETPGCLSWLLLTGGYRSINKVVGLVFADDESTPRLAVKFPRVPESIAALEKEAQTLRAVHDVQSAGVRGAPKILSVLGDPSTPMVVETCHTGVPVWALLRRGNFRDIAIQATDWLSQLVYPGQLQTRDEWWERVAGPALADFERAFGGVVESAWLQKVKQEIATLECESVPLAIEQRDFSPWNVLVSADGGLVVLDWESAELRGLPAMDLIYCLTYLTFFMEGIPVYGDIDLTRVRRAYCASLSPDTFTGRVVHECLGRYAERHRIAPQALRPLRLLAWLIHSRSEVRSMVADGTAQEDAGRLRRSLFLALLEEEMQCQR